MAPEQRLKLILMSRVMSSIMASKVCIVTGANAGLGKATSQGLCELGATVVMACRDSAKAEAAKADIIHHVPEAQLVILHCDLASQVSIEAFVAQFLSLKLGLDVLVNNAGLATLQRQETEDGLERIFAVNYLGHYLLTRLLVDKLIQSRPARVVNVAGMYHKRGEIFFDDLQLEHDWTMAKANNQAQLARVLFSYELARRLAADGVTVNCLHPGAVRTEAQRIFPWYQRLLMNTLLAPVFISPERGAQTGLYLASAAEVKRLTGKYFVHKKPVPSSTASYDQELAQRLWEMSEMLLKVTLRPL